MSKAALLTEWDGSELPAALRFDHRQQSLHTDAVLALCEQAGLSALFVEVAHSLLCVLRCEVGFVEHYDTTLLSYHLVQLRISGREGQLYTNRKPHHSRSVASSAQLWRRCERVICVLATRASRTSMTTLHSLICESSALNVLCMCPGYQLMSESPSTSSSVSTADGKEVEVEAEVNEEKGCSERLAEERRADVGRLRCEKGTSDRKALQRESLV